MDTTGEGFIMHITYLIKDLLSYILGYLICIHIIQGFMCMQDVKYTGITSYILNQDYIYPCVQNRLPLQVLKCYICMKDLTRHRYIKIANSEIQ